MTFKKIYIEIGNVCNLQCSFCPEVERDKKLMDPDTFARVLDQSAPLTEEVCLHLMGEPLAHPRLTELVEIASSRNVRVNLTTNGILLDKFGADFFLAPVFRQVNFSLHSFRDNFPGKDMGPYLKKIFSFTTRALERRPDLYINYRLWNLQQAGPAPTAEGAGNSDVLSAVASHFLPGADAAGLFQVDVRFRKGIRIKGRLFLHFDTRFEWPSPDLPHQGERGFCHGLSTHIGIHADGTVVPCCLDKEARIPLGSVLKQELSAILEGERARQMKDGFQRGELVEDLCRHCPYIKRFGGKVPRSMGRNRKVAPPAQVPETVI